MKDDNKTKKQLIDELAELRKKLSEPEAPGGTSMPAGKDLKAQGARNGLILRTTHDGFWVVGLDGNLIEVNDSYCRMVGYSRDELLGMNVAELEANEDPEAVKSHIEKILREGEDRFETRHRRKDSNLIDLQANVKLAESGGESFFFTFLKDITENKRAEEELRLKGEIITNMTEGTHLVRASDGIIIYANPRLEEMFGYGPGELNGKHVSVLNDPSDTVQEKIVEQVLKVLRIDHAWSGEVHNVKKDGTPFWCYATVSTIEHPEHGEVAVTIQTDITEKKLAEESLRKAKDDLEARVEERTRELSDEIAERKRAEEALKENEKYLNIAQEIAHIGHWKLNPETNEVTGSDEFFRIFGLTREESTLESFIETVHPEDREFDVDTIGRGIEYGENWDIEHRLLMKDGTEKFVQAIGNAITDETGKTVLLVGTVHNITERKRLEQESLKAQKLESVGVLAGGIAHDFNNIITGILGNISLARIYSSPESKAFERLVEAENAVGHATRLAQQLLTFSKGGKPVKETAYIRNLIKDAVSFSLSGSNVRCAYSIQKDLWPVDMDTGQMSQVFSNLAINARHAMPEGGLLKVGAENITTGDNKEDTMGGLLKEGQYVKISIEDNGTGIDKIHLDKIFDPYFSTKEEGSGLGLATSYSIINKHDGHITVESKPGAGTTFHLYLRASKELPRDKGGEEIIASLKGKLHKGIKVLVMDDEEIIRDVAGEMLTSLGYKVDFAIDGDEAIELYRKAKESGEPFGVVIMDLTIPGGMGGKEAIKKLLEVDPGAKVIVSSGYSNDPVMSNYKNYGFRGVIAKPYKVAELSAKVHKVIAGEE